ncbi:MAG: SMC-Scp complex subunit ScpB [Candidatus Omnitrophica bacterium]|nr:SMC-Scp complex subunit ScpB [Candidatus Omnitrophota bacterium]
MRFTAKNGNVPYSLVANTLDTPSKVFEKNMSDDLENIPLERTKIKSIIESLLFVNERPLSIEELHGVLDLDKKDIEAASEELIQEYKERACGVCIVKVAGGYQMCSLPDNESWIKEMYRARAKQKLSIPALETLAIIAYKQPITRMEIESIRGVNIDGVIKHLLDLGLIKTEGRKEVVGRPFLYITTRKFLEYFGLNHLKDLPKLEEFVALAEHEKNIDMHDKTKEEVTQ